MGVLWSALFLLLATGAGIQVVRWLGLRDFTVAERTAYGAPVGLGVAAYGVLAIGLLGRLTPAWIIALVGLVALLGARQTARLVQDFARNLIAWAGRMRGASEWTAAGLVVICIVLALLTLIPALAPPADLEWDSLTYHLAAPKIYLRHASIHFIEYDSHTNFPFTVQMLYVLGLAWGEAPAAKIFHWAMSWLTAVAIAAWIRRHLGGEAAARDGAPGLPAWAPPLGAALWLSIPITIWEAGTAYVDLGTALFQFTALAAVTRAIASREGGGSGSIDRRWALLAGLLTGWALGTKATALIQFFALGVALFWVALRRREQAGWTALGLFAAAALLVGSPWYVKSYLWTNNPVYPFLYPLFPRSVNWNMEFHVGYQNEQKSFGRHGPQDGLAEFLRVPWDQAFHGRHFFVTGWRVFRWDRWASMGILLAAFGPLLLFTRGLNRKVVGLAAYVGFSLLVWWFLSKQSRYLLPVYAALPPVAVGCILALPAPWLRRAAVGIASLALAVGVLIAGEIAGPAWPVVSGQVSRSAYLEAHLPGLWPAVQFVNRLGPDTRVAFYQETRGYYFDRDYFWANPGQHDLIPYEQLETGSDLVAALRRHGITHVLVNLGLSRAPEIRSQKWWQLLGDALRSGEMVPVFPPGEELPPGQQIAILELR